METEPFLDEDGSGIKHDNRKKKPQVYPPFLVAGVYDSECDDQKD
jgi:hypothetical protein